MNALANESSPYLLQHKNNPVNWIPWSEEAFEQAKKENKTVLISIGYSACHWCHVMEHESFEDAGVAEIMNANFVCIKVDREERPDVDHLYMQAVQLMTQQGGWPLNCFVLPNKKPFYGGTYFPKEKWKSVLNQIITLQKNKPEEVAKYANQLATGISKTLDYVVTNNEEDIQLSEIQEAIKNWSTSFDNELGGSERAPKFPMPVNYQMLLKYGILTNDAETLAHAELTLDEMARGGIYDQIGGGFTRYSVDKFWKVPHFEKMLYDNAQLLTLYAKGYNQFKKEEYKHVITQTLDFCKRELQAENGLFYCALDADSEGVEGKYYVWTREEVADILSEADYNRVVDYYNMNAFGEWEGNYIPLRQMPDSEIAKSWGISTAEVANWVTTTNATLLQAREKRIKPGLDNKILCSWNCLMIIGINDSSEYLHTDDLTEQNLKTLLTEYYQPDLGKVLRVKTTNKTIEGFLDDYALLIKACLSVYKSTHKEYYVLMAKELTDLTFDRFFNLESQLFEYAPSKKDLHFSAHYDVQDDVIPSSNSVMAENLKELALIFSNTHYQNTYEKLLKLTKDQSLRAPYSFGNWLALQIEECTPAREIVITGTAALAYKKELATLLTPSDRLYVSTTDSELPIFKNRYSKAETLTFVCENKACGLPAHSLEEAIALVKP